MRACFINTILLEPQSRGMQGVSFFFVIGDHEEFPVTKDFVEGNEKYQDWRQIPLLVRGLAFCFAKQGGIVL